MADLTGIPHLRPAPPLRAGGDRYDVSAGRLLHAPATVPDPLALLVGVPFDTTTLGRRGSGHGPGAVRDALAACFSYDPNWGVDLSDGPGAADLGNVDVVLTDVETTWQRISEAVRAARGEVPLVILGGDHGVTFPTLRGLTAGEPEPIGVVNVDAHFDVRVSQDGQVSAGVPFRYALERLDGALRGPNFVELGAGGWRNTRFYHDYLDEQGAHVVTARQLARGDFDTQVGRAFELAADGTRGIWLSIDADAFDAAVVPGTAAPAVAGLTAWQGLEIVWAFGQRDDVLGMDIVEVAPPYDPAGITASFAAHLLLTFLAARQRARTA